MGCNTPTEIAQEVKNQGGSSAQAWIAAAMVGCESNGCTNEPAGGGCATNGGGIFQFLPSTWRGLGGQGNPCDASLQQQVAIFLKASAGGSYHDWNVDFYPPGTANVWGKPYPGAPQPGSCFAKNIATLSSQGLGKLLGNVPTNWADAGAVSPGLQAGTGQTTQDSCAGGFSFTIPLTFGAGKVCLLSRTQIKAITSAMAIAVGAGLFAFGVVMLAAYEYDRSGAKQAVNSTAKKFGVGAALLAGQPEAAGVLAASGKGKGKKTRTVGLGPSAKGSTEKMSRSQSKRIEDMAGDLESETPEAKAEKKRNREKLRRMVEARNTVSNGNGNGNGNGASRPRGPGTPRGRFSSSEADRARWRSEGFPEAS